MKIFAPGVIKLFGEHAVVYGKPAIAATIDKGVYIHCEKDSRLAVETAGAVASLRYYPLEERYEAEGASRFFIYVKTALEVARERWGPLSARFIIQSDLPPAVGAATSAAVSVGLLKAYSTCLGLDVEPLELARLGHRVELEVQGIASPMDTTTASLGGVLKIWANPFRTERLEVDLPPLYIAILPRSGTTGEIVADVKRLLSRRKSLNAVIEAIGQVVEEAERCLASSDLQCVGELMEINNWLLGALGVVDRRAVDLLENARPFIYGGKISGAGKGGVVILLPREGSVEKVLQAAGVVYYKAKLWKRGVSAVDS
ncbi:MAG: mevalonate kinase [Pyrobaculum sp.]